MSIASEADWERIREQMDAAREALEQGFTPSGDEQRRILKARAHELAREPVSSEATANGIEVVEFDLANERYGIALTSVREVCLLRELTPVPCTPPFVLGIINLRGEIRTVIDLKKCFDLPEQGITDLNKILLVRHAEMQLGILADRIRGVRAISPAELQPVLPTLTGRRADYVLGVTSDCLVVLDAKKILSDSSIIVREEVP